MKDFDFVFVKQQIKMFVTIEDVFRKYAPNTRKYKDRYKCPFNDSENRHNFSIKNNHWYCFSCGTGGDEISFVQKMFDLSPVDAAKLIMNDFRLKPLPDDYSSKRLKIEAERRQKQRESDKKRAENLKNLQNSLHCKICELVRKKELEIEKFKPKTQPIEEWYKKSYHSERCLSLMSEVQKLERYLDILAERDIDYIDDICTPAFTNDEKHARMIAFLKKVYNKEVII